MSRIAITLQRRHGEDQFQVVSGPEVPVGTQLDAIKQIARSVTGREHPEIAELQVWTSSDGCRKRFRFSPPGEITEPGDDEGEGDDDGESADEAEADLAAKAAGAKPLTRAEKRAAAKAAAAKAAAAK